MARRKPVPQSHADDILVSSIKEYIQEHPPPRLAANAMLSADELRQLGYNPSALFPTVSEGDVANAEADLGFQLPPLLKRLYTEVSNGIAGFAYDLIGLKEGCACHCGTLVDTYLDFKKGGESESKEWQLGLLPFCHWGCNIFSCVDCTDAASPLLTYEDSSVWAERYTLPGFFEMWLKGNVLFSQENVEIVAKEITNPFTGKGTTLSSRRRRKPST
jgi:hypothetical protein